MLRPVRDRRRPSLPSGGNDNQTVANQRFKGTLQEVRVQGPFLNPEQDRIAKPSHSVYPPRGKELIESVLPER